MSKTYTGTITVPMSWSVSVKSGDEVYPLPLYQDLRNHSPDGFAWGYEGSGPAQLALALCADVTGDGSRALRVYQQFKRRVIAKIDQNENWSMTQEEVMDHIHAIEPQGERDGKEAE